MSFCIICLYLSPLNLAIADVWFASTGRGWLGNLLTWPPAGRSLAGLQPSGCFQAVRKVAGEDQALPNMDPQNSGFPPVNDVFSAWDAGQQGVPAM